MPWDIRTVPGRKPSLDQVRSVLRARLEDRRSEIEGVALARVQALSDPGESDDPEYVAGLRAAVSAALDYALLAIERGGERSPRPPAVLLIQARLAARYGVNLDTVLRRYLAGYTQLGDFLIKAAEEDPPLRGGSLTALLRSLAARFDRLIAAVSEEYRREAETSGASSQYRRAEQVDRLLGGELVDLSEFNYELSGHHLGLIAVGEGAAEAIRELASEVDRRILLITREEGTAWAWLGGRRRFDPAELCSRIAAILRGDSTKIAVGEPGEDLAGWRLTHRQAKASLAIGLRGSASIVRYADIALLASAVNDNLLSTSLHQLYIAPLERDREGGTTAKRTLRAYIASGQNVTSAAAALGVNRNTVANRLSAIEGQIGQPLSSRIADVDAALRLSELSELPARDRATR